MNISISTTQWGDVRQAPSRDRARRQTRVVNRNLIMALMTVTLASLMIIQAVGPAAFDHRPVVDSRSVEVVDDEEFLALEELSVEQLLISKLSRSDISSDGSGLNAVPK